MSVVFEMHGYNPSFAQKVREIRIEGSVHDQRFRKMFDRLRLRNNAISGDEGTDIALPLETIIDILARRHGYSLRKFQAQDQRKLMLAARDKVLATIKKMRPDVSLPELGDILRKDHATILIAIRRGEKALNAANDKGIAA